MKFYQSIKFRIVATTLTLGILLVVLSLSGAFLIAGRVLDQMVHGQLKIEMDYVLYKYRTNGTEPQAFSPYVSVRKAIHLKPEHGGPPVTDLPPGVHDIHIEEQNEPVFLGALVLPDTGEKYYLLFDAHRFFKDNKVLRPNMLLLILLTILVIPGIIVGTLAVKVMFRPINELIDKIRDLNPDQIPDNWEGSGKTGEMGILTQTIESTMKRIREAMEREKQFTRDASHELRTPLTIVKGAMEVMEDQTGQMGKNQLQKPMDRIQHAVNDMENLIETFLWLAREGKETRQTCRVSPAIYRAVENNEYLIGKKEIQVKTLIFHDPKLAVNPELLYITITNIIRNAFQFTPRGLITITLERDSIAVTDTGTGIEPHQLDDVTQSHVKGKNSKGFGLGLSIVTRLCDRYGWQLDIHSTVGKGTQVKINWKALE